MNTLKINGTRFSIVQSTSYTAAQDLEETKKSGYTYADVVVVGPGSIHTYVRNKNFDPSIHVGTGDSVFWLRRETKKFSEKPRILGEQEYKAVLTMAYYYCHSIISATSARLHTYYYGVIESLLCFSGDQTVLKSFYESEKSFGTLKAQIWDILMGTSKRDQGQSVVKSQDYRRYNISSFASDLISDGAELIMDDSIYKYNWQGRASEGFGNIKPTVREDSLYPKYRITDVQGNQTNANLSLKFDFNATYDTGSEIKILDIKRNLTLVKDGSVFQDMVALHVSPGLQEKLNKMGLVDAKLPGANDILVNLTKIPASHRAGQSNKITEFFLRNACLYHITKKELESLDSIIQWTPDEAKRASDRAAASNFYWSLNKDRVNPKIGKRLYTVKEKDYTGTFAIPAGATQESLRELRKKIQGLYNESYKSVCLTIYNFLCSKKSAQEYFGLPKKGIVTGRQSQIHTVKVKEPEMGLEYECEVKFL